MSESPQLTTPTRLLKLPADGAPGSESPCTIVAHDFGDPQVKMSESPRFTTPTRVLKLPADGAPGSESPSTIVAHDFGDPQVK